MANLSLHLKMFNDKVRLMNQLNQKDLVLSAQEARNLHSDIFEILNRSSEQATQPDSITSVNFDGGKF